MPQGLGAYSQIRLLPKPGVLPRLCPLRRHRYTPHHNFHASFKGLSEPFSSVLWLIVCAAEPHETIRHSFLQRVASCSLRPTFVGLITAVSTLPVGQSMTRTTMTRSPKYPEPSSSSPALPTRTTHPSETPPPLPSAPKLSRFASNQNEGTICKKTRRKTPLHSRILSTIRPIPRVQN